MDTGIYEHVMDACLRCGGCTSACTSLQRAGLDLHGVAAGMQAGLAAGDGTPRSAGPALAATPGLVQAVRGCFFCTECVKHCPAGIDVCSLVYTSRDVFQEAGLIERGAWSSVLVDEEWHIFSAYRAIYGIGYGDLTRHVVGAGFEGATDCAAAFFPGCSLAAYGPQLTREVFSYLEGVLGKCTLIDECCGSPLHSAGFPDRAAALEARIVSQIVASGARSVVFTCPGCANIVGRALREAGADIEVTTVARVMREHGRAPVQTPERLRVFKSCQDRDGSYLADTLALFSDACIGGTIESGCCGAGGAVSAFCPEQQQEKVQGIMDACPSGETLVTMCPTCTYTQAYRQYTTGDARITCKNYLELLFAADFDWNTVFAQLTGMWSGEYGPWLSQVFA